MLLETVTEIDLRQAGSAPRFGGTPRDIFDIVAAARSQLQPAANAAFPEQACLTRERREKVNPEAVVSAIAQLMTWFPTKHRRPIVWTVRRLCSMKSRRRPGRPDRLSATIERRGRALTYNPDALVRFTRNRSRRRWYLRVISAEA